MNEIQEIIASAVEEELSLGGDPKSVASYVFSTLVDMLGLTEETNTFEDFEVKAVMGGSGAMAYGGQTMRSMGYRTQRRWVTAWSSSANGGVS